MSKINKKKNTIIWISWENQRRSVELAKVIGAEFYMIESSKKGIFRYAESSIKTIKLLKKIRPKLIFVQNPSVVLAALACILKYYFKYTVIVDRHTNFKIGKTIDCNPAFMTFRLLSLYSLRAADLTIVTNYSLVELVKKKGGTGFVLTDKIPGIKKNKEKQLIGEINLVFICTFATDEPYLEVIQACRELPESVYIYITGNHHKIRDEINNLKIPKNLVFTGFLEEQDYIDLLFSCDAIMDLTTLEYCLVCGGYEAMAAGKPLLTSNTQTLKEYYYKGARFCDNSAKDITYNIVAMISDLKMIEEEILELRVEKDGKWMTNFHELKTNWLQN
jgi:glycosyltransferase involved in cell wall biosynthesis